MAIKYSISCLHAHKNLHIIALFSNSRVQQSALVSRPQGAQSPIQTSSAYDIESVSLQPHPISLPLKIIDMTGPSSSSSGEGQILHIYGDCDSRKTREIYSSRSSSPTMNHQVHDTEIINNPDCESDSEFESDDELRKWELKKIRQGGGLADTNELSGRVSQAVHEITVDACAKSMISFLVLKLLII